MSELINKAIWDKYCPKVEVPCAGCSGEGHIILSKEIDEKQRRTDCPICKGEKHSTVFDPDVLWVGSILDGLVNFMPELFDNPGRSPRRTLRSMLDDFTTRPMVMGFQQAREVSGQMWMERDGWPHRIALTHNISTIDPGRLINSPVEHYNEETGEVELCTYEVKKTHNDVTNLDETHFYYLPAEPRIREDKRYQLHLLRRDDLVGLEMTDIRKRTTRRQWKLRRLDEGSSLMPLEVGLGIPRW
jgi:hypothetical protein